MLVNNISIRNKLMIQLYGALKEIDQWIEPKNFYIACVTMALKAVNQIDPEKLDIFQSNLFYIQ